MDRQELVSKSYEYFKRLTDELEDEIEFSDGEIKRKIQQMVYNDFTNVNEYGILVRLVYNHVKGFGIIQDLIDDKGISEIMINGQEGIYVEKKGTVSKLEYGFEKREQIEDLAQKLANSMNKSVTEREPILDVRLLDGSRVNIILYPIALNGPIITIRKFPDRVWTIEDLVEKKTMSPECAEYLKKCISGRKNLFVCGGTSSGKTTLLNALARGIPLQERIITIEDSAELQMPIDHNVVRLETRKANSEGIGEVTMSQLIKASLRSRPDRVIVGEVRGAEAIDMLTAMNCGHDGSLSTGHSNSARDMLTRLESMVLLSAPIPIEAVKRLISTAINILVYVAKGINGRREVREIYELEGLVEGEYVLKRVF